MKTPAPADLQRWSDEVARDPRSHAFLPLARAYRRQGLREAALQLCLRGLEAHPHHVEAHGLLALLHVDAGNVEQAADEWSIVLRLDPDNFDALRGLGFCHLEADQLSRARQLLERAAGLRPEDPAVQGALRELGTRQELQQGLARTPPGIVYGDDPWASNPEPVTRPMAPDTPPAGQPTAAGTDADAGAPDAPALDGSASVSAVHDETGQESATPIPGAAPVEPEPWTPDAAAFVPPVPAAAAASEAEAGYTSPTTYFDEMLESPALLGVLLVDEQGLLLAGRLTDSADVDAGAVAAVLGSALGEAARAVKHLGLGSWRGMLMETRDTLLHVRPVGTGAVLVAARRDAPAGWILRAATRAAERAARYAEAYS